MINLHKSKSTVEGNFNQKQCSNSFLQLMLRKSQILKYR